MDVFEDWDARFPRGEGIRHRSALTNDSVFLFEQLTSPRPSTAYFGTWHWYENALQLKAHLMNVVMPDMASTWLSEGALGLHVIRQPLQATLDDAMEDWDEDLDLFRRVAEGLAGATGGTNKALAQQIQAVTRMFTERFGQTPTWDLGLTVFTTTVEAGAFLFERSPEVVTGEVGQDCTRETWLNVCGRAGSESEASALVTAVFDGADEL